jgi:hypothetical protein
LPPEPGVHATFARDHEYKRYGTLAWTSSIVVPANRHDRPRDLFQYDPEHSEPFSESIMRQNQRAAVWTALQEG